MLLPSALGVDPQQPCQYLTSFLVNGSVAIDAGSIGFYCSWREQARVKHIFLTHSHIDHVASLPVFLENVYEPGRCCVTVHGSEAVLDSLQRDLFNNRIWPDFVALSNDETPLIKLAPLVAGAPVDVEGLRLTPVPVNHVVPTMGYLIEDQNAAVGISSDTAPTAELWQACNAAPNFKAVFLEVTFPNSMARLAETAKHLTPELFAGEIRKLRPGVRVIAFHIKPRYFSQIALELEALNLPNYEFGNVGVVYEF